MQVIFKSGFVSQVQFFAKLVFQFKSAFSA